MLMPAWRNQSIAIETRTCKHLRQYLGEDFEKARLGGEIPARASAPRAKASVSRSTSESAEGSVEADTPGILLAHSWGGDIDLTGWWMSEKLDGVRAYWDGKQFISRQGNVYLAPDWFTEALPADIHLDGELWLGRKGFQRAVSILRRQDRNNDWKEIKFVVFDAPKVDDVFEARMAFIQQTLDELCSSYAEAHLHVRCKSEAHLREELARVESMGGEGLMLRQPSSKYEVGRSFTLLKVKTFHDAEAKVIEYLPGTGKHKGRLGALAVELADGTHFSVGTGFSDAERENPPAVGSIITFRYQELSDRGVPRFPSFVRQRSDVSELTSSPLQSSAPAAAAVGNHAVQAATQNAATAAVNFSAPTATHQAAPAPANLSAPTAAHQAASPATPSSPTATHQAAVASKQVINTHANTEPSLERKSDSVGISPKAKNQDKGESSTSPADKLGNTDDSTWRIFHFVDGTSNKFWQIKVNGNDVSVRFGRIGTQGQEKTKSFSNENTANSYAEEITNEKVGKGYTEQS